jgi:hypothetical protein
MNAATGEGFSRRPPSSVGRFHHFIESSKVAIDEAVNFPTVQKSNLHQSTAAAQIAPAGLP